MASTLELEGLSRILEPRGDQLVARPERGLGEIGGLPGGGAPGGAPTFGEMLRHATEQVNLDQQQADVAVKELLAGRTKNVHEAMLAIERADTSLKLMMQVRNKVLDAYREVMRMQV